MPRLRTDKPDFKAMDRLVRELPAPATDNHVYKEPQLRERGLTGPWLRGLALRVTAAGARSWVLGYRAGGVERRYTIGSIEAWPAEKVWPKVAELRRIVDAGGDPQKDKNEEHAAPTVQKLIDRYRLEHLPAKRATSQREDEGLLRQHIIPAFGKDRVANVTRDDIQALHRKLAPTPVRANRTLALLSTLFELAVVWKMRPDNPSKGIKRYPEERRERFLTTAETERLMAVLDKRADQSADAIGLLLMTGARRSEILQAKWSEIDLDVGAWTKPSAHTKQKRLHRIPLNQPARALLKRMRHDADKENERRAKYGQPPEDLLFPMPPSRRKKDATNLERAQVSLQTAWEEVREEAQLVGVRLHDLRHSYASILASSGLSLPVIGQLLGHTQVATTQRYSHLTDEALRAATEKAGQVIAFPKRRRA